MSTEKVVEYLLWLHKHKLGFLGYPLFALFIIGVIAEELEKS